MQITSMSVTDVDLVVAGCCCDVHSACQHSVMFTSYFKMTCAQSAI